MSNAISLNGVSETMLVTLFYRAKETQSENPLIQDQKSVEIVNALDYDFSRCTNNANQACIAVRTRMFQDSIRLFISEHPNCVIVNLAAGLDNRFDEVDNGTLRWFDLDLPDVIDVRKHYIAETDRRKFIGIDALDTSWLDMLGIEDSTTPVLIVAEGLLPYLPEDKVIELLETIGQRFPISKVVFEIFASFIVGREWIIKEFRHIRPRPEFQWSPYDGYELDKWSPNFKVLKVENQLELYKEKWGVVWYISRLSKWLRNAFGNRVVTMDLNSKKK